MKKKYIITDPEHVKGGREIEAENLNDAAEIYFDEECLDVGPDEETSFTITHGHEQWEVTIEVFIDKEIHIFPITKAKKTKRSKKKR